MDSPYAEKPHLDIERHLAQARRERATEATVTLDQGRRVAVVEDNRPGKPGNGEKYTKTFNTRIHPSTGYQWQTHQMLRGHIVPPSLETRLRCQHETGHVSDERMAQVGENTLAQAVTREGRYRVDLTEAKGVSQIVIVNSDGSSQGRGQYERIAIHHTPDRNPGTEVETTLLQVVAAALRTEPEFTTALDDAEIADTATRLAAQAIAEMTQENLGGYAWANQKLRSDIHNLTLRETGIPEMPQTPSTAEYRLHQENGGYRTAETLTPENAALCDYDDVQSDMLLRAVRLHAPRNVLPVRTKDPHVPVIRLIGAEITNLDGTTVNYPVNIWKMEYQSGRYDGRPTPKGDRLPHSRAGRVRNVRLTMEIRRREAGEEATDIFSFDTDVYNDQDSKNHLLLVTENSEVTPKGLEGITYLHSPRNKHLPEETRNAADLDHEDLYSTYLVEAVLEGTRGAAKKAITKMAASIEALDLANRDTGTRETLVATSPAGQVRVILNPHRQEAAA